MNKITFFNDSKIFFNLLHANRILQGQAPLLSTQASAFLETDSTIIVPFDRHSLSKDCSKAKTIAKNSASSESFTPIETANFAAISPQSFLKTPPMLAQPGLPLEEPSTFHFHTFCGGLFHSRLLLTVCFLFQLHTASRLLDRSTGEKGHSGHQPFNQNPTLILIKYANSIQSIILFSKTNLFR
jgi:hypothetical protein